MKESFEEAVQELKRVDHIFYVSLKYTRTADMMKHMIERLISTFQFGVEAMLRKALEEKRISSIPDNQGLKAKLALELFPEDEARNFIQFYIRLRRIIRAPYTKREEFRRHVTMTASLDNGEVIEVNIDLLKEYYDTAKAFLHLVRIMIYGEDTL